MNKAIEDYIALKISTKDFVDNVLTNKKLYDELSNLLPNEQSINNEKWKDFTYNLTLRTHKYDLKSILKFRFSNGNSMYGKSSLYDFIYKILKTNGFNYEFNDFYQKRFSLLLDVLPNYIDGEEAEKFLDNYINSLPKEISENQMKKQIKNFIKEHFLTESKSKPRWVQEAEWPVTNGEPLIFVSQKKTGEKMTYIFKNNKNEIREIVQYFWLNKIKKVLFCLPLSTLDKNKWKSHIDLEIYF